MVDFELTRAIAPADFLQQLAAQLPPEIPLYDIAEVPLDEPSATKRLDRAEYYLRLSPEQDGPAPWSQWVEAVMALDEFWWEKKTKSGKTQMVNLRERLHELALVSANQPLPPGLEYAQGEYGVWLRAVGNCRNDGNLLRPEQVVNLVEQVANQTLSLSHVHRSRLIFS